MQGFLSNLLGPIFMSMGVSEADFASYLESCMGYVYGIIALLVILIIVLILAHKLKKGKRAFARITAILLSCAVITAMVNSLCVAAS